MQSTIKHEWFYEQAPAEVWAYLTDADLISLWLMPNNFKPLVGHEFEFRTSAMPEMELDGIYYCKVQELVPFQKLVYSWKGGPGAGVITMDTLVEWILEPKGQGTLVKLTHSGFKKEENALFIGMTNGWLKKIEKIATLLTANNGSPQP